MLNYAGEVGEAGSGYTCTLYSFICGSGNFSGHPMIRPPKLGLGTQNSVGMLILRVTTIVQNLGTPDL